MKNLTLVILLFTISISVFAQTDNTNKKLANYITTLYNEKPFEGVKIVEDKDASYLISLSIQSVSGNKNSSTKNRVAQIKARRNAMVFLNGSNISSETILKTGETITNNSVTYYETFIDEINENAAGFLDGMQVLTSFTSNNNKEYVYIIYKKL